MKKQNNKGAKNILKDVVADCFNKSVIIAKNIWEAPIGIDIAIKRDLEQLKRKQGNYPNGSMQYTLDDEDLQKDFYKRIETLRDKNVRNLIEKYSREIIKETLEKDNYLIGYNQAYPQAIYRINYERDKGLLDEFYLPVEKGANGEDKRNYKRG